MKSKRCQAMIGVVDNDESIRVSLSSMLRSANWGVVLYASAEQLLGDARCSTLSLVITDIQMPGMDGFSLLASIKRWTLPVPVICITAFPTAAVRERANVDGAAGFFAKPVDDERLLGLIDELLDADTCR